VKEMVNKYETIFIVDLTVGEENVKAIVEKFKNMFETSAQLDKIDEWGKKRLAYPINDLNDGYYVFVEFSSSPEFPQELERVFRITEGIMRHLVIRKED
jgi:small subunit ribosomal protein S6